MRLRIEQTFFCTDFYMSFSDFKMIKNVSSFGPFYVKETMSDLKENAKSLFKFLHVRVLCKPHLI